jgi:hypothetical protein
MFLEDLKASNDVIKLALKKCKMNLMIGTEQEKISMSFCCKQLHLLTLGLWV